MRTYLIAALAVGTFAASPAFAQTQPNMGGFHVDGIVGYDRPRVENEHAGGVVYGMGVGYDVQSGRALFGVEGEVSDSTADRCVTGFATPGDSFCARAGRDLYVGGRVGAIVGGRTLLYAKAGYTNGRIRADYDDGTPSTVTDFSDHRNLDGVRAGVGAQFGIGANAYVRTEYRYSNYEAGVDRHQVVGGFGVRF
jgi:outer membrane immunogenic protein